MSGGLPAREVVQAAWERIRARSLAGVAPSLADRLWRLPAAKRDPIVEALTPIQCMRLLHDWEFWARPKQLEPRWSWGEWWLLGGRGSGKSRPAAELVDSRVRSGQWRTFALCGPDYQHVVKFMVGGEKGRDRNGSGLCDIARPWCRPELVASALEIRYPNGAIGHIVTADKPEFRGPNLDGAWCDEPTKWRYADRFITNLRLTLREPRYDGSRPQSVYTTNPARLGFLLHAIADDQINSHVTHMTTWENRSNLSQNWLAEQARRLGGTQDGRRELEGEEDWFGDGTRKLFDLPVIDAARVDEVGALDRVAVSVDPGASTSSWSDPTGLVAVGADAAGDIYVLADATEDTTTDGRRRAPQRKPEAWAAEAIRLLLAVGASEFVAERNKGGDMVAATLRAAMAQHRERARLEHVRIREVYSVGDKAARAAPVRVLYQSGRVHHVGRLVQLEDEMTTWEPGAPSPNRLDALVTGVRALREDITQAAPAPGVRDVQDALEAMRATPAARQDIDPGAVAWGGMSEAAGFT